MLNAGGEDRAADLTVDLDLSVRASGLKSPSAGEGVSSGVNNRFDSEIEVAEADLERAKKVGCAATGSSSSASSSVATAAARGRRGVAASRTASGISENESSYMLGSSTARMGGSTAGVLAVPDESVVSVVVGVLVLLLFFCCVFCFFCLL